MKDLDLPSQSFDAEKLKDENQGIEQIPLASYKDAKPLILLGMPHANLIRPHQVIPIGEDFALQETRLGWVAFGGNSASGDGQVCQIDIIPDLDAPDEEVKTIIKEFFDLDIIVDPTPPNHLFSDKEQRAQKILETTTELVGDRYQTGLL